MAEHRPRLAGAPAARRALPLLVAAGVCVTIFLAIVAFVFGDASAAADAFDRALERAIQQYRATALTGRIVEISALGSAPVLAVIALFAFTAALRLRDGLGAAHLTIALVGASVLARVLQALFERERPETLLSFIVVTKGSFPSAHLFGAAASYVTFAFLYTRWAPGRVADKACWALTAAIVLLIGMTRVYLGAHHATDVIAGIAAGAGWGFLVAAAMRLPRARAPTLTS